MCLISGKKNIIFWLRSLAQIVALMDPHSTAHTITCSFSCQLWGGGAAFRREGNVGVCSTACLYLERVRQFLSQQMEMFHILSFRKPFFSIFKRLNPLIFKYTRPTDRGQKRALWLLVRNQHVLYFFFSSTHTHLKGLHFQTHSILLDDEKEKTDIHWGEFANSLRGFKKCQD